MSKAEVFIQDQVVVIASAPSERNRKRGRRLTKKAILIAVFTWVSAQSVVLGWGLRVVRRGNERRIKIKIKLDVIITE